MPSRRDVIGSVFSRVRLGQVAGNASAVATISAGYERWLIPLSHSSRSRATIARASSKALSASGWSTVVDSAGVVAAFGEVSSGGIV